MICPSCYMMLRGQAGRQWKPWEGPDDLQFSHMKTDQLQKSASIGCCICRSLYNSLARQNRGSNFRDDSQDDDILSAYLSKLPDRLDMYRLDFELQGSKTLGTFFLKQASEQSETRVYTPVSEHTDSEEVLELARSWIRKCTSEHPGCPNEDFSNRIRKGGNGTGATRIRPIEWGTQPTQQPRFYPSRLVELPRREALSGLPLEQSKFRLIDTSQEEPQGIYVTLSHCWGGAQFLTLKHDTMALFRSGNCPITSLPLTFREAMDFATRLNTSIRYIWIDSLCIIQDDDEDWLTESMMMYQIYRSSYLNISATAGENSHKGLYHRRIPQHLWESEVKVNTEKAWTDSSPLVRRCTIQDPSLWNRLVDGANVNRRAWVLQERLLAPRVLHFCEDQIAWECRHLDAAEYSPDGIPTLGVKSGKIQQRVRMKGLLPEEYGPRAQVIDSEEMTYAAHENWKRVVERYSTTGLTNAKDKLIAVAGIAEMMAPEIPGLYVAGLWEKYLASQLLWRVEPLYVNKKFEYNSERSTIYRAPTFSWAAINASQGIRCGETKPEHELDITVEKIHVRPKPLPESAPQTIPVRVRQQESGTTSGPAEVTELKPRPKPNPFGLIDENCFIELTCTPIRVRLSKNESPDRPLLYTWSLPGTASNRNKRIHPNVYLDSPNDDYENAKGALGNVYCVPADKDHKDYLICLLLQKMKSGAYQRIGLTTVPAYAGALEELRSGNGVRQTIRVI